MHLLQIERDELNIPPFSFCFDSLVVKNQVKYRHFFFILPPTTRNVESEILVCLEVPSVRGGRRVP